jgi:hypothetical protein
METKDILPMQSAGKEPDQPLLKVLTEEEKKGRIETAKKGESTVRRMAVVSTRAVMLNLDVIVFVFALFCFLSIGYTYARLFGLTADDIKKEAKDFFELFFYVILGIASAILKMAMSPGSLAQKFNERLQNIRGEINKSPQSLNWYGMTEYSGRDDREGK